MGLQGLVNCFFLFLFSFLLFGIFVLFHVFFFPSSLIFLLFFKYHRYIYSFFALFSLLFCNISNLRMYMYVTSNMVYQLCSSGGTSPNLYQRSTGYFA